MQLKLTDSQGSHVELGSKLGDGGEGSVFEVVGSRQEVAKIYHSPPTGLKRQKLEAMVASAAPDLQSVAAWPNRLLYGNGSPGAVAGFVMPRLSGYVDAHLIYGQKSRVKLRPDADWAFLTHTARNLAIAFQTVHERKHLVADINPKNVTVSPKDATVKLIDCDSFQIQTVAKVFSCDVGVLEFTPPELQGQSLSGLIRTENHDRFGLSLLIFHLLFLGRHPFYGRPLNTGDMPIERAIKECRFAWGAGAPKRQMAQPPFSLPLTAVGPTLAGYFEQAFTEGGKTLRPAAKQWADALGTLGTCLATCPSDRSHKYSNHLRSCPWCEIADAGGPYFFVTVGQGAVDFVCSPSDLDPFWHDLLSWRSPSLPPPAPSHRSDWHVEEDDVPTFESPPLRLAFAVSVHSGAAGLLFWTVAEEARPWFLVFFAISAVVYAVAGVRRARNPVVVESRRRAVARRVLDREARGAEENLAHAAAAMGSLVQAARKSFEEVRASYSQLKGGFDAELKKMEADKADFQKRAFLDSQLLEDASITGVGPGTRSKLAQHNVESAWDVLHGAFDQVPGVVRNRDGIRQWARSCESSFRFNRAQAVPEAEVRALVRKYKGSQAQLRNKAERIVADARTRLAGLQGDAASAAAEIAKIRGAKP